MKTLIRGAAAALMVLICAQVRAETTLYDQSVETIDGVTVTLDQYKGKALLIVNSASRCGYTPQYAALEELYETYKDRGFEVLAFPSNDFMNQEPGSNEEIKQFCLLKFNTTFPLFAKIHVKGEGMHPLYKYLTEQPGFEGPITWNFNKFLISPAGEVAARFDSKIDPMDASVTETLEELLEQ